MSSIVADFRTLKSLERAGYILLHGNPRSRTRHWTGSKVRVLTVDTGPRFEFCNWWEEFTHNNRSYRLTYIDGCFHKFVVRTDNGSKPPVFI